MCMCARTCVFVYKSQDSIANTASMLWAWQPRVQIPIRRQEILLVSELSRLTLGTLPPPPHLTLNVYWGSFLEKKQPKHDTGHSPPSSAEITNKCSYTGTPIICLHGINLWILTPSDLNVPRSQGRLNICLLFRGFSCMLSSNATGSLRSKGPVTRCSFSPDLKHINRFPNKLIASYTSNQFYKFLFTRGEQTNTCFQICEPNFVHTSPSSCQQTTAPVPFLILMSHQTTTKEFTFLWCDKCLCYIHTYNQDGT
jgi:hypothetical protein